MDIQAFSLFFNSIGYLIPCANLIEFVNKLYFGFMYFHSLKINP